MRTSVYVFDCPDLTRGQPSTGSDLVDVGAREDSRTGQGVANDVVPNLVVVQDVAFRETASRSASMSAWVILLSKSTPSPLTSRKNIALLQTCSMAISIAFMNRSPDR